VQYRAPTRSESPLKPDFSRITVRPAETVTSCAHARGARRTHRCPIASGHQSGAMSQPGSPEDSRNTTP
jgi:hypothetical protein